MPSYLRYPYEYTDANKTAIKKIIGHSSYAITEKIYTHKDIEEPTGQTHEIYKVLILAASTVFTNVYQKLKHIEKSVLDFQHTFVLEELRKAIDLI